MTFTDTITEVQELGEYAGSVYFIYSYTIDLGMKKLKLKLHILLKIIGLIFVGSVSNTHKSNYWQESWEAGDGILITYG